MSTVTSGQSRIDATSDGTGNARALAGMGPTGSSGTIRHRVRAGTVRSGQPALQSPKGDPSQSRELRTRFATAALLLPPVCGAIWYGAPAWPLLLGVAGVVSATEYYRIVFARLPPEAWPGIAAAAVLPLLPDAIPDHAAGAAFWLVTAALVSAWLVRLSRGSPPGATDVIGQVLGGLLFSAPGLFALAWIRTGGSDGRAWIFALLLVTWSNDGCAYGVGRALGRHKLAPTVSPGKTWEGLAGGLLGSLAATLLVDATLLPSASLLELSVLGVGTALVGPLGDLTKSMVKRAHGVKDSGRLLPGHGGLLDRIDALLWNSLLVAALRAGSP